MPRSIPKCLSDTAHRIPDKLAIASSDREISYGQLWQEALSTAESLKELGIQAGDRVGVCMEKSIDQALAILGILLANAVLVPILPRLKTANIRHIIENSGMTAMVTDAERISEVIDFAPVTKLIAGHGVVKEEFANVAYMRKHIQPRMFFDRIGSDNAAIIYSSGSTGRPKGILISHTNLVDGADICSGYLGTTEADRICCVLSFNFDYGLNQIWQAAYTGASLYLHELALPNDLFACIADNSITALPLMPVVISRMFDKRLKMASALGDFSSMRYVCTTGGRLSDEMINDLRTTFPTAAIYSMFGLTEAFRSTYLSPSKLETHPRSIGKAIPGCEVLVLDKDGKECPPNVIGELVQRGATVSKGYWNDPANTAKVFRTHPDFPGETLVFSGDNVVRDEDGFLYFVARRDEMIKTRGFRVSPTEVESEVVGHDEVSAAVAFAIPNIEVGEDIGCAYTSASGQPIAPHKLTQYLKAALPRHMVPAHLFHFDAFPVTGNEGKFDRKSIKQESYERLGVDPNTDTRGIPTRTA